MLVKIFGRPTCPKCPPAKALAKKLSDNGIEVKLYNLDEADGLSEGTLYEVMSTPTTVVADDKDKEIISWRGETPTDEEVKKYFK